MHFTVLGGRGFIGSHLVTCLRAQGIECWAPERQDPLVWERNLGHVVYSVGLTADFRHRALDTVEAHVCMLVEMLRRGCFDSLLYLSSARVYRNGPSGDEDSVFNVNPQELDDLYDLSKLMGEAACFASGRSGVRVARLSNVYGSDWESENFLPAVIRSAVDQGRVVFRTSLESAKDYVSIGDVAPLLVQIALQGEHAIYNVAAGENVSNRVLAETLESLTGCEIAVADEAPTLRSPRISIRRVSEEFGFTPASMREDLRQLLREYQEGRKHASYP